MSKKFSPGGHAPWVGLVGAGILSIVPLFAASATLSAVVSDEKVSPIGPQTAIVSWTTDVPTGSQVVYGSVSHATLSSQDTAPLYGYSAITPPVSTLTTRHEVAVGPLSGTQMIYLRPVSTVGGSTVLGDELSISLSALSGSCGYVTEYLKKGASNDPEEVKNLQAFLRGVEKDTTVHVTGIFDDATLDAVHRFQKKYAEDILAPWGVTESTGYVYITTKRKINEIFCSTKIALTKEEEAILAAGRNGGVPPTEIGGGAISSDGTLVWGNGGDDSATGTAGILEDAKGSVVGSAGAVKEKLSAVVGGTKNFLSQNQILLLLILIAAFSIVYLSRNNKDIKQDTKVETKLLKGK